MIKRLYILTPIYPSKYSAVGATPIVHYFAKEWVKMGYDVHAIHIESSFPKIFYCFAKLFRNRLSTVLGHDVATSVPHPYNETKDGVVVNHIVTKKIRPHTLPSAKELRKIIDYIILYCKKNGNPDYFIGHWDIPQLEILTELKQVTHIKTALVLHNQDFNNFEKIHGPHTVEKLEIIDAIGFRNRISKENYIKKFGEPNKVFMAYSGVSDAFLKAGENYDRIYSAQKLKNFIYVGTLIKRKYPMQVLKALNKVYKDGGFRMVYIGEGGERRSIVAMENKGELVFTGRIERNYIIEHLKEADVFIMISRGELFGLVYLEAMSLGCITIASKREGIDGIIKDGYNGFLCEAGNTEELADIIHRINKMSNAEKLVISINAKNTARQFSDKNVAKVYIEQLLNYPNVSI